MHRALDPLPVGQDERVPTPRLLTSDDWPEAELRAAVLAGELVAVGRCWASPAEPQVPALRAAAHAWRLPDRRLVAGGRSAAWIWGATAREPAVPEVVAPPNLRVRVDADVRLREVRLEDGDVVVLGTVRVTTPLRTALDLLRAPGPFATDARDCLRGSSRSAWSTPMPSGRDSTRWGRCRWSVRRRGGSRR